MIINTSLSGSDSGGTQDPFDFGETSGNLTRETLGSGYVYKTTRAFEALKVKAGGTLSTAGVLSARYAATKPTATTLSTHGKPIWSTASGTAVSGEATVDGVARNTYIWFYPSVTATLSSRDLYIIGAPSAANIVEYDSGTLTGSSTSRRARALDLGVPTTGTYITRESGHNSGYVYKTTQAFKELRIAVSGNVNHDRALAGRTAATAPANGGANSTHGTPMFYTNADTGASNYVHGTYTFIDIPANTYFWFYIDDGSDRTLSNRTFAFEGVRSNGNAADAYTATYTVASTDNVAVGNLKYDFTNEDSVTDAAGNAVAAKAATAIANTVIDTTAPTISSVTTSETTLVVTMSERVYAAAAPDISDFAISGVTLSNLTGLPSTPGTSDSSFRMRMSQVLTGSPTLAYTQNSTDSKRLKDKAGNPLATASSVSITIASVNAPSNLDLATADDTGDNTTDNLTKNTTGLTITGCAKADSTITLYKDEAAISGTVTADGSTCTNGSDAAAKAFTKDIALTARTMPYEITAKAVSGANTSAVSDDLSITIDTTAPTTDYHVETMGGTTSGSTSYLGIGDTLSVFAIFNELMGTTTPIVQFKNNTENLGSAITSASVSDPSSTWTNNEVGGDTGGTADPLSFGTASGGITREALGSGYVYKTTQAFTNLRVSANAVFDGAGNALIARYASSVPATTTVATAGTQLFNAGSSGSQNLTAGTGIIPDAPIGTYFWLYPSGTRTAGSRGIVVTSGASDTQMLAYSSGTQTGTDDGSTTDPLNFGTMSGADGIVREALGDGFVYKTTKPFAELTIQAQGSFNTGVAFRARTAATKPTATNMTAHGTQMWSSDTNTNVFAAGMHTLTNIPINTYFWFFPVRRTHYQQSVYLA